MIDDGSVLFVLFIRAAAGLGEARIRDLNDEINKLLREKGHWERQIRALGGPDYAVTAPKLYDGEALELPGSGGYRYFGAAKDLPGVKELFSQASTKAAARRSRGDIAKNITPDYYGYRDEDDGVLVAAEAEAEKQLVADAVASWKVERESAKRQRLEAAGGPTSAGASLAMDIANQDGDDEEDVDEAEVAAALGSAAFKAHVPLPQQQEIEAALLERKKAQLLAKYAAAAAGSSGATT